MIVLAVLVLSSRAMSAPPCQADICLGDPGTGVGFDGITFMADVSFGFTFETGKRVGMPQVVPRVAVGGVFAGNLREDLRYPIATPYVGFGPVKWTDSLGQGVSSYTVFLGANVLGFGDIGYGWAFHDTVPANLSKSSNGNGTQGVGAQVAKVIERDQAADMGYCKKLSENWEGWYNEEGPYVPDIWKETIGTVVDEATSSAIFPDPPTQYWKKEGEAGPDPGPEAMAKVCANKHTAQQGMVFMNTLNDVLGRTEAQAWDSDVRRGGFGYISLSAVTGVRSLTRGLGLNQSLAESNESGE